MQRPDRQLNGRYSGYNHTGKLQVFVSFTIHCKSSGDVLFLLIFHVGEVERFLNVLCGPSYPNKFYLNKKRKSVEF